MTLFWIISLLPVSHFLPNHVLWNVWVFSNVVNLICPFLFYGVTVNGWMETNVFADWFDAFADENKGHPMLLLNVTMLMLLMAYMKSLTKMVQIQILYQSIKLLLVHYMSFWFQVPLANQREKWKFLIIGLFINYTAMCPKFC